MVNKPNKFRTVRETFTIKCTFTCTHSPDRCGTGWQGLSLLLLCTRNEDELPAMCSTAVEACSDRASRGLPALRRVGCGFVAWGKKCDPITNLVSMDEELRHQYF